MKDLTRDRLRELLVYDPDSGSIYWRLGAEKATLTPNAHGHLTISIDGKNRYVHRVAHIYMVGWAPPLVDHENRNPQDNRWDNLRKASKSQNAINGKTRSDNTSGFRGVCRKRGKWRAYLNKDGRQLNLGSYDTKEAAAAAYAECVIQRFGDFAPIEYRQAA